MSQAQELYSSSKVLWRKSTVLRCFDANPLTGGLARFFELRLDRYQRVAFLLIGLAVENLAKGIVIGREAPEKQEALLTELSRNHDIRTVLSKIDETERPKCSGKILEKLEAHILWASKYPVPKKPDGYKGDLTPKDFDAIENLYRELLKIGIKDNESEIAAILQSGKG